jgi:hypothetical protein
LKDLPHSRQYRLPRGVMSPQNGQTRWGESPSLFAFIPNNCSTEAEMNPSQLRTREEIALSVDIMAEPCGFSGSGAT